MRRLPLMLALAAVTLLALPAVVSAADPTPVPVVDPAGPPVDPSAGPVVDPSPDPAVTPSEDPTTVSPGDPGSSPAEPPVACAPDAPDCVISPIVILPMPCPEDAEVCAMGGGVPVTGPGASDQPLIAPGPLPAGGMFFSITKISDGTNSYDVEGTISMGPDGLTATVGCNTLSAAASFDAEGVLQITGPVASTKMACLGDPGAAEALLVQLLGAGTVTWDGTALTGGGITADAMQAMADGLAPVDLAVTSGVASGAGAEVEKASVGAASGAEGAASTVLLLTAAALVLFLVAGGLVARRVSRQS